MAYLHLVSVHIPTLALPLFFLLFLTLLWHCIYTLYLGPLKSVPGPKIAALTRLYEFYHNAIRCDKYGVQIESLHDQYGPIVRINPNEVHVRDAKFQANFTSTHRGIKKDNWIYNLGLPGATGLITDERKHRQHRTALIAAIQPKLANELPSLTQKLVEQLVHNLRQRQRQRDTFNASDAFRSLSRDILSPLFISKSENLLGTPDLGNSSVKLCKALFQLAAWHRQFPFLGPLAKIIPECVATHVAPHLPFQRSITQTVTTLLQRSEEMDKPCVVQVLAQGRYRSSTSDIADEAVEAIIGGTEAIGHGLTNLAFHIAKNKRIAVELRQELIANSFHPNMPPNAVASKFPYLAATVKEGLRTEIGNIYRFARTLPYDITYREYALPAGTVISMCPRDSHEDESIFHDHSTFIPERWLEQDAQSLEKYLMAFGHGGYKCLGVE
ncbi:hypothetical protein MMC10_009264 [Thelotrema lepadinum]|nr:hypothetical protein [Thelotrema lepadinum]